MVYISWYLGNPLPRFIYPNFFPLWTSTSPLFFFGGFWTAARLVLQLNTFQFSFLGCVLQGIFHLGKVVKFSELARSWGIFLECFPGSIMDLFVLANPPISGPIIINLFWNPGSFLWSPSINSQVWQFMEWIKSTKNYLKCKGYSYAYIMQHWWDL